MLYRSNGIGALLLLVVLLFTVGGCSSEESIAVPQSAEQGKKLQLIAPAVEGYRVDGASTRMPSSSWKKGDKIVVFISQASSSDQHYIKFINVSDDPKLAVFEPEDGCTIDLSEKALISAFYPYMGPSTGTTYGCINLSVDSFPEELNDLKMASAYTNSDNAKIYLNFKRLTARVVVKLYHSALPPGMAFGDISLKLTHTYYQCKINYFNFSFKPFPPMFETQEQEPNIKFGSDAGGIYEEFSFNVIRQDVDLGTPPFEKVKEFEFYENVTLYKSYRFPADITTVEAGKYYEYEITSF